MYIYPGSASTVLKAGQNVPKSRSVVDVGELEHELCRIPGVTAARVVMDEEDVPVEVHVLATTEKHAKQLVRDVQSVAITTFGLDIDRRVVSVVQLDELPGAGPPGPAPGAVAGMEDNYNRFLATLKVYDPHMTEQQRLILRVARIFGECELAMPPDFVQEVESYIAKWKSSGRYARAIRAAVQSAK